MVILPQKHWRFVLAFVSAAHQRLTFLQNHRALKNQFPNPMALFIKLQAWLNVTCLFAKAFAVRNCKRFGTNVMLSECNEAGTESVNGDTDGWIRDQPVAHK